MRRGWSVVVAATCLALIIAPAMAQARAGSGVLTAPVFMKGMRLTVPSGWVVFEDHPGEFNITSHNAATSGTAIHFWLDPYASGPNGVILHNVARTPSALIAWLRANPLLSVSAVHAVRIASGISARYLDVNVAASAPKEDPTCPGPCQTWLMFKAPDYDFPFGTARGEITRVYLATLRSGSAAHTFVIAVDAPAPAKFRSVSKSASTIIATVRLPSRICASC